MRKLKSVHCALLALLPLACAHTETPKNEAALAEQARLAEVAREEYLRKVIHIECSLYVIEEVQGDSNACHRIDFALEDSDGVEVARMNPDREGKLDFPVESGKTFRVKPKVPRAWTIEWVPAGDVHAGETQRIILRR